MSLFVARHSETRFNVEGRLQGRADSGLTMAGDEQAYRLARYFSGRPLERIYSSPLGRAIATAEVAAQLNGIELVVAPELVEIDYGEWEGCRKVEIAERFPDLWRQKQEDRWHFIHPGGESVAQVYLRAEPFFSRVVQAPGNSLVVCHYSLVRCALHALAGLSIPELLAQKIGNDDLFVFENGSYRVVEF